MNSQWAWFCKVGDEINQLKASTSTTSEPSTLVKILTIIEPFLSLSLNESTRLQQQMKWKKKHNRNVNMTEMMMIMLVACYLLPQPLLLVILFIYLPCFFASFFFSLSPFFLLLLMAQKCPMGESLWLDPEILYRSPFFPFPIFHFCLFHFPPEGKTSFSSLLAWFFSCVKKAAFLSTTAGDT